MNIGNQSARGSHFIASAGGTPNIFRIAEFFNVAIREGVSQIPPDRTENNYGFEVSPFEQGRPSPAHRTRLTEHSRQICNTSRSAATPTVSSHLSSKSEHRDSPQRRQTRRMGVGRWRWIGNESLERDDPGQTWRVTYTISGNGLQTVPFAFSLHCSPNAPDCMSDRSG